MPVCAVLVEPPPITAQASVQAIYEAAVADRRAGRHGAALAGLEAVLETQPSNLDARLNLGLSLLALNRLDEAEVAFEAVLAAAPTYVDARLGLAQVARRRGDASAARRQIAQARATSPDRPDVLALARSIRGPDWHVDIDTSRSRLSNDLPDWTALRLAATRRVDDWTTTAVSIEWTERFGTEDVYLEGQANRRWRDGAAFLAVGGAADADYRPELALRAGAEIPLGRGLSASVESTIARYRTGTVRTLQPGLSTTLASERLSLATRWIQVWDEAGQSRSGYAVRATWSVTDRSRVSFGYADAPETSEGITVPVQAAAFGFDLDLTDRLTARLGVTREDRGTYDRNDIALGLGVRF